MLCQVTHWITLDSPLELTTSLLHNNVHLWKIRLGYFIARERHTCKEMHAHGPAGRIDV